MCLSVNKCWSSPQLGPLQSSSVGVMAGRAIVAATLSGSVQLTLHSAVSTRDDNIQQLKWNLILHPVCLHSCLHNKQSWSSTQRIYVKLTLLIHIIDHVSSISCSAVSVSHFLSGKREMCLCVCCGVACFILPANILLFAAYWWLGKYLVLLVVVFFLFTGFWSTLGFTWRAQIFVKLQQFVQHLGQILT